MTIIQAGVLLLATVCASRNMMAQVGSDLRAGAHIRFLTRAPGQTPREARVLSFQHDSLTVRLLHNYDSLSFNVGDVTTLEVRRGTMPHSRRKGFLWGGLVGGVLGAVGAVVNHEECDPYAGCTFLESADPPVVGEFILGGLLGGLVGMGVATVWRSARWEMIPLPLR